MRTPRGLIAALAVGAALALTTTACAKSQDTPPAPAPATSAADTAKVVLESTIPRFEQESFTFTLSLRDPEDGDMRASGSSDPATRTRMMRFDEGGVNVEYRILDTKRFLRLSGVPGVPSDKWMLIDAAKIGPNADRALTELDGPSNFAKVFKNITEARDLGNGRYAGTIDLTKAVDSMVVTTDDLTKLAEKAKAVPFEATVDSQGRLTRLLLTIEAGKNSFELTVSDWGTAAKVAEPPAADTVEAPELVYGFFSL